MSDLPRKDPPLPVYIPAAPGWWLHPYGGTGIADDSPIIAWRIYGSKALPVIPDHNELAVGGLEVVFKDSPSPSARAVGDSPEYGLGGRNYADTRELKQKTDEAKAWQDANTAPEPGGVGIFPHDTEDPL
jgi:hypothetical protein